MVISLKRIYEAPSASDGTRILVERLWPRGISKERAAVDYWAKEIAPSHELRKWFNHDAGKWEAFKLRYFAELDQNTVAVADLRARCGGGPVTFVFAARDERLSNASALTNYLERRNISMGG